jgi:hypothetical protein
LTETSTRHSLLTKHKTFREAKKPKLISNSNKLTGDTSETAIQVEDAPVIPPEESEEDEVELANLPSADEEDSLFVEGEGPRRSKRSRRAADIEASPDSSSGNKSPMERNVENLEEPDEKKKMGMDTTYEGFAIYGRVLCLVVKRRDKKGKGPVSNGGGKAMMEDWITSTQMPPPEDES